VNRVLIVSDDAVASRMAGPAIRDWEYARALSREFTVTLAVPNISDLCPTQFALRPYDTPHSLQELTARADVVITSGYVLKRYPFLKTLDAPLVFSIPHSFDLENLQHFANRDLVFRWAAHNDNLAVLNEQLLVGDFFVCNSERQRDFWLGMLSALGRVNPLTFSDDPSLRRLIDVVSFGLPDEPPLHRRPVLKGVYPGIAAADRVLFWGGGLYDWLDPLTALRALAQIIPVRPEVKLFFAATQHPSPNVVPMEMLQRARRLSDELGLTGQHAFFNDWIPYEERESYLLEADLGLSLHLDHLETRYAFRNRVLDAIWASLPMVVTEGDMAAELVERYDLGYVVGYQDVTGLVAAILALLDVPDLRQRYASNFARVRERYRWSQTTQPLAAFCRAPRAAPDRQVARAMGGRPLVSADVPLRVTWHMRLAKGWRCYREQGLRTLATEVMSFLHWRLGR